MRLKSPPFYFSGGKPARMFREQADALIHLQPAADKLLTLQIYALYNLKRYQGENTTDRVLRSVNLCICKYADKEFRWFRTGKQTATRLSMKRTKLSQGTKTAGEF